MFPGFFLLSAACILKGTKEASKPEIPKHMGKKPTLTKAAPNEGSGEGPPAQQDGTLKNGNHSTPPHPHDPGCDAPSLVRAWWGAGMFTPTETTWKAWAVALSRRCPPLAEESGLTTHPAVARMLCPHQNHWRPQGNEAPRPLPTTGGHVGSWHSHPCPHPPLSVRRADWGGWIPTPPGCKKVQAPSLLRGWCQEKPTKTKD